MNKNLVIFIVASLAIYMGWMAWMKKYYPAPDPAALAAMQAKAEAVTKSGSGVAAATAAPAAGPTAALSKKKSGLAEQHVSISTDTMQVTLSNAGAKISSLKLISYREHTDRPDSVQLVNGDGQFGALELSGASLDTDTWRMDTPSTTAGGGTQVVFSYTIAGTPITLRKTFTFEKTGYVIHTRVEVANAGKADLKIAKSFLLWGPNIGIPGTGKSDIANLGGAVQMEGKLERLSVGDPEARSYAAPKWVAIKNHYFVAAYMNEGNFPEAELRRGLSGVTKTVTAALGLGELVLKAGETKSFEAKLYAGPQDYSALKAFGNNLNAVVQFSFQWISPLSVFLLSVMKGLHVVTRNWGFAIIFLTLLVKLALFYPTHKGMVSSRRMQTQMAKMAPVLESLKKTYKDDAAQLQKETMRLYKEHGVNPLSGCFLMLPQMFIMISLYGALNGAFELRGASFIGPWTDLSAPDPTFILVPLMGASMWLQQKMTPANTATMTDEQAQMQKMMSTMMPLMFTVMGFIFKWPTGLLLYWSVSNVFGIGQQWYVNRNVK